MGDSRRFQLFAKLISHYLNPKQHIGDIAGGKGQLKASLWQLGYRNVTTWDRRHKNAKRRNGVKWGEFTYRTDVKFHAVVGMHPDEATDHIIKYAIKRRVVAIICPCCIKPSATVYEGVSKRGWVEHLLAVARGGGMMVTTTSLPMKGDNLAMICRPRVK